MFAIVNKQKIFGLLYEKSFKPRNNVILCGSNCPYWG